MKLSELTAFPHGRDVRESVVTNFLAAAQRNSACLLVNASVIEGDGATYFPGYWDMSEVLEELGRLGIVVTVPA